MHWVRKCLGFPGSLAGKESTCNAEDPGSTPGSGRSTGEEIDYPLQYSWVSLVAQTVKNLSAMQETWVQPLVGKIPWRTAWQLSPVFLPGESPQTEEPGGLQSVGLQRVGHNWATEHREQHRKCFGCILSLSTCLGYLENIFLIFTMLASELKLIPALHSEWLAKPWLMMALGYSWACGSLGSGSSSS